MSSPRELSASSSDRRLDRAVAAMASADTRDAGQAREKLVALAADRMRSLAHRMLAGSARVRRWEDTDDLVQGAMLRLHRALGSVVPNDAQHFVRLAALQVRRELIDLTRRHRSSESFAANHETNSLPDDRGGQRSDRAEDPAPDAAQKLAEWTRFHDLAASLPDDERQLFDMVWYLGMTQDEIAVVLGCSARTIRRRWDETKRRFTESFKGLPPE
jgi:RNA polymerase sigma factor (sigma-70 family)